MRLTRKYRKGFLSDVKKACTKFNLISEGDKIAVGISGGKDSSALLYTMRALQYELPQKFEVVPIHLALGWEMNLTPIKDFCNSLGYELIVKETQIADIIFNVRKEKNPCSLCAKMRRGALHDIALHFGCNKVALGHHLDDVIETYFMNLIFTGQMKIFKPSTFLDRKKITVIRPMVFVEEKVIRSHVASENLPVIKSPCPADKNTKREEIKSLVRDLAYKYRDFRHKFLVSLLNFNSSDLWKD